MNVEPTSDLPVKMDWVQVAKMVGRGTVASVRGIISLVYMILYPGIQLIRFLVAVLQWALDPFMRLGFRLFHLAVFPLRVLAKFEAIFTYFIMALLTGVTTGLVLYYLSTFIAESLNLSTEEEDFQPPKRGHRISKRKIPIQQSPRYLQEDPWFASSLHAADPLLAMKIASRGDYFTGWSGSRDTGRLTDSLPISPTILEEDEYSTNTEEF